MNDPYKTELAKLADLKSYVGKELGVSTWILISQEKIDAFAQLTDDAQWIHTDIEKARKYSPYQNTIAHGFLILSLASF